LKIACEDSRSGGAMEETISELRIQLTAAAEALREYDKRATAGQLALELMHEVRNPLEALGNLIFLTAQDLHEPEKVQEYMDFAAEQIAIVNQLVSRTLSFARPSNSSKMMNLVAITEAALRIHQRAIEGKKIQVIKDISEDVTLDLYPTEFLQVISNLIVNAIHALSKNGILCLRIRKRQSQIQFLIGDNGHGIPSESRGEIFKPFFTTKEDRGVGLGLSLSREIVERHQGKMSMRSSVRPDQTGTVFRISFPCQVG
jgi:signal transduction histidine kinase